MQQDEKQSPPSDSNRVGLVQAWEVQYWRRHYGCTERQLKQAVAAVGDSAAKVKGYLRNKSTPAKGGTQRFD